ncbi:hypothetical protein DRP53_05000 [candidate division WOR-3 bacterium]|uniref:DUF4845 domain-containing protein n=1 Tax=candidate division WOR-3 bacterium TaxID=2052148 RepID=A0A660SIH0_UNCW3|nr:MAG: hypothetical protein DRP53_05000 [candidate division WOR-3 bacterium]
MNRRGISGFTAVFLILVFVALIYVGYSIGTVWFRAQSFKEKIKETLKLNALASDSYLTSRIIELAKEAGIQLGHDDIFIDRSIPDSILAVVEYQDSSVLPVFTYRKLQHIEVIIPARAQ